MLEAVVKLNSLDRMDGWVVGEQSSDHAQVGWRRINRMQ